MIAMRARLARYSASALLVAGLAALVAACTNTSGGTGSSPETYYVSPSGNNAAAGTSPGTAWRTLGRASSAALTPGSRVLLRGGQVFDGQLTLGPGDAGSASDPVLIGSYGGGDATIFSPASSGIYVHDIGGVDIQDLKLVGPSHPSDKVGINVYNDLPAGHRLDHIVIGHVAVSGFLNGITIGGVNDGAGFSNVEISDANLHDNIESGLLTYGPAFNPHSPTYANMNVLVSHVIASRNRGNPGNARRNTGNGIVLGSVTGGTVIWSVANDNGGRGAASQGPAGIWAYDSANVDIEHDLSYGNRTRGPSDGNGFGLDQNTSNSVLQYDLSYGNDGTGYLVYSALNDGWQKNNVVRNNISSGDVRDGSSFYGGITVIGFVEDAAVYQNTVVMTPASAGAPPLLRLGPAVHGVSIWNNLFSTESGPIIAVSSALFRSGVILQGNDYFSVLGPWQVVWGPTTYSSLSAWRAGSSQEIADGRPTGLAVNPEMIGPVLGLSVKSLPATAATAGFGLKPDSPLIGAGLDIASLGVRPAAVGYSGRQQSAQHPNIGAF